MNFDEAACVCALILRRRRKKLLKRTFWVHPIISSRLLDGQFHKLFGKLAEHPNKFFNYFRMSRESFDELLGVIGPRITYRNTSFRQAVPPQERLAVTIRYLATGNSFASLHYEYLLGETTIREVVRDTCDAIWECLLPNYMPPMDQNSWLKISKDFNENTNFPNCLGAVDGKHIRIQKPDSSGSEFFNYKSFFSIVLLAIADSNYNFVYVEVGAYGSSSDANIFKKSDFSKLLETNNLNVPGPTPLPNDENGRAMPFVLIGDEAFALSEYVLRPYPNKNLSVKQRIFNYRLTRGRRVVECSFGILANKWRIFHRPLNTNVEFCDSIIKACCILHNYVRRRDGVHFEDTLYQCPLGDIENIGTRGNKHGTKLRDDFADYFTSPRGCIPWQYDKI